MLDTRLASCHFLRANLHELVVTRDWRGRVTAVTHCIADAAADMSPIRVSCRNHMRRYAFAASSCRAKVEGIALSIERKTVL